MFQIINTFRKTGTGDGLPGFRTSNNYRNKNGTNDGLAGFRISNNYASLTGSSNSTSSPTPYVMREILASDGTSSTNATGGDKFGGGVAIYGDYLIIGAPGHDLDAVADNTTNEGAAYIYNLSNGTPVLITELTFAPVGVNLSGFDVAISNTKAIICAPTQANGNGGTGVVTIYDLITQIRTEITADSLNILNGDSLALSVAVDGNNLILGTSYKVGGGNDNYVYIFDITSTPVLTSTLSTSFEDRFGTDVAISGNIALIGSPRTGNGLTSSAIFYNTTTHTPTYETNSTFDQFGTSVAIDGIRAVIGAPKRNNGQGSVFYYSNVPTLSTKTEITSPDSNYLDFGISVAISGTKMMVSTGTTSQSMGRVYLYDVSSTPTILQTYDVDKNTGDTNYRIPNINLSIIPNKVAIQGDTAVYGLPTSYSNKGSAKLISNIP